MSWEGPDPARDEDFAPRPRVEMREETRAFFAMSAGRDEAAFIHDHEKLSPSAPLARFVKEATALIPPSVVPTADSRSDAPGGRRDVPLSASIGCRAHD